MAIYRNIQISYWQDDFVLNLTPEEKFFYIYLMTNSKTKQCGIYELTKKVMCFETGYNIETIDKLLDRFVCYDKIFYDNDTNEIMIINWLKHNKPSNENIKKCIIKELSEVKSSLIINKFVENYSDKTGTEISPLQAATKGLPSNKNKNKNNHQNNHNHNHENKTICHEPVPVSRLTILKLPTNKFNTENQEFEVKEDFYLEMKECYPAVDVDSEFKKMRAWLISNPVKRKTLTGMKSFINKWFSNNQNKGNNNANNATNIGNNQTSEYRNLPGGRVTASFAPEDYKGGWDG